MEWQNRDWEGKFRVDVWWASNFSPKTFVLISLPCLCLNKGSTLTGQGSRGAGGLS